MSKHQPLHPKFTDTQPVVSPIQKQAPPLLSRISTNIQKSVSSLLQTRTSSVNSTLQNAPVISIPPRSNKNSKILHNEGKKSDIQSMNSLQNHFPHDHAIIDITSPITTSSYRHSIKQRRLTATSAAELDIVNSRSPVSGKDRDCDTFPDSLQETDDQVSVGLNGRGLVGSLLKSFNPGIILLVFQSLFATLSTLTVKTLVSSPYHYNTFNLVLIRSSIIFIIGYLWQCSLPFFSNPKNLNHLKSLKKTAHLDAIFGPFGVRTLILFRSCVGFSSSCLGFYALQGVTVGEATVISFLSPIFVGILGALILNEKWEKLDALASIVSLIGVIIIVNPSVLVIDDTPYPPEYDYTPNDFGRLKSITAGILGAFTSALVYISVRQLKNKATAMQVSTSLSVHSIYFALIASWMFYGKPSMAVGRLPTSWTEMGIVLCLSTLGLFNQLFLNIALKFLTAAKASCLNFCQVPFSFVVEYIARGRVPTVSDVIGGCTIVSCVLAVSLAKVWREKMQKESNTIKSPQNDLSINDSNFTTKITGRMQYAVPTSLNRGLYLKKEMGLTQEAHSYSTVPNKTITEVDCSPPEKIAHYQTGNISAKRQTFGR